MRVLAEFARGWADEFDVHGLAIMTIDQFRELKEFVREPRNWHFGTNEGWEEETFDDSIRIVTMNQEDILVIETTIDFRSYGMYKTWGHFPDFDELYPDDAE